MTGEIDKDFYCSANYCKDGYCDGDKVHPCGISEYRVCEYCRRKHPTPEQFKEEYGFDTPEDMPVWAIDGGDDWSLMRYRVAKAKAVSITVCACTPWGKPPAGWRRK